MSESNRCRFPALAANQSANDRIRVAIVGLRSRGRDHIQAFHALKQQDRIGFDAPEEV